MFESNIYNIDRDFDYATVKAIVIKSLEKIAKEEAAFENSSNVLYDSKNDVGSNNIKLFVHPRPLLKLKIRNTTQYLNWRIAVLRRDNFTCKICHASVKENKTSRLEVHHPKAFDDICKENNVSTKEQALECKELWNVKNGISICYRCHKDVEKIRTKLRNMFRLETVYTST
jgi:5-methylcytosine-specific restriction endonuclease McrA